MNLKFFPRRIRRIFGSIAADLLEVSVWFGLCMILGNILPSHHEALGTFSSISSLKEFAAYSSVAPSHLSTEVADQKAVIKNMAVQDLKSSPTPFETVSAAQLHDMTSDKRVIIVDARPESLYNAGHVPSAVNLPVAEFAELSDKWKVILRSKPASTLVIYCFSESCPDNRLLADKLASLGFRKILLFRGGWSEWISTRLPVETK